MGVGGRGIASNNQMRGPQHSLLTIANVSQDMDTILNQDKSEGAMAPLGPIVATLMVGGILSKKRSHFTLMELFFFGRSLLY